MEQGVTKYHRKLHESWMVNWESNSRTLKRLGVCYQSTNSLQTTSQFPGEEKKNFSILWIQLWWMNSCAITYSIFKFLRIVWYSNTQVKLLCVKRIQSHIIEAVRLIGGAKGGLIFITRIPFIPWDSKLYLKGFNSKLEWVSSWLISKDNQCRLLFSTYFHLALALGSFMSDVLG